jgi:sugar lactone lactonase YvrE
MNELELVESEITLLGEGPIWDEQQQVLYYLDIEGRKIIKYDPSNHQTKVFNTPSRVGFLAMAVDENWIVGLEDGLYKWQRDTEDFKLCQQLPEDNPKLRINDGKCGPGKVLWFGTMDLECVSDIGAFYRMTQDGQMTEVREKVCISNGLVWKQDLTAFYYIDTKTKCVTIYDYDKITNTIANGRTAFDIPAVEGSPDGMTMDNEGMLWIAHYGGYQVARWHPETGKKLETIAIPAKNVTCCVFGGELLDELYITTHKDGDGDHGGGLLYRKKLPYHGYLSYRC